LPDLLFPASIITTQGRGGERHREYGTNGINGTNGNKSENLLFIPFVPYSLLILARK
jgi:hypothetical protein